MRVLNAQIIQETISINQPESATGLVYRKTTAQYSLILFCHNVDAATSLSIIENN